MGLILWTNLGPIVLDSGTHPDSLCNLPARVPHLHCELAAERAIREHQKWSLKRLDTKQVDLDSDKQPDRLIVRIM